MTRRLKERDVGAGVANGDDEWWWWRRGEEKRGGEDGASGASHREREGDEHGCFGLEVKFLLLDSLDYKAHEQPPGLSGFFFPKPRESVK